MKSKIKSILKKTPFFDKFNRVWQSVKLKRDYSNDYKFFKNNYIFSSESINKCKYHILYLVHSIEKGMTNSEPRPFGFEKIKTLIMLLNKISLTEKNSFEYNIGMSCLDSYKDFFISNNWSDKDIYKVVSNYLHNKEFNKINVGAYEISKNEVICDVDFRKLLDTRHSTRKYLNKKISKVDINKAIEMSALTPSACNRQMCKIYYVNDEDKRNKVISIAQGFGNFDLTGVNVFIITFDVNANYSYGERNQGWFNAGLLGMNFVNALHSLHIGSCFLQFANSYKEECELKKYLNISESERIAVIISAGYYCEKTKIPYSIRKNKQEIFKQL